MIKKIYDTFIFKYPIIVLLILSIFVSILGYYSTKVEVDASAETLLLDDDKDLKFFREVNKRYNNLNFLIVTFAPHEELLSNQSLDTIRNLSKEFLTKLNEQVLLMNNEEILVLIKEYNLSEKLQNHIKNLINEFKYQELIDFTKKLKNSNNELIWFEGIKIILKCLLVFKSNFVDKNYKKVYIQKYIYF